MDDIDDITAVVNGIVRGVMVAGLRRLPNFIVKRLTVVREFDLLA